MRPRSIVQVVIMHNDLDENGETIPRRFEVGSWVLLQPGLRGGHSRDARKHGGESIEGAYKARILEFIVTKGKCSNVVVQHAYQYRQLELDPNLPIPVQSFGMNYLYPSEFEDSIDAKSIMSVIMVVHADIGAAYKGGRTPKELLSDKLFFYNAKYHPPTVNGRYGHLEPIPLEKFDDPAWPLPDMLTTESYRARMRLDFLSSMKPTTGSRQTHLQWFMPVHVMVDLFSVAPSIHRTSTMFVFRDVSKTLLESLMDCGWDDKVSKGDDIIKCKVDLSTIVFCFHIARSVLYTTFQFNRERLMDGSQWVPIDQTGPIEIINVNCKYGDKSVEVEVGKDWLLSNVRQEISFTLGDECPPDFSLRIIRQGLAALKVNRRTEKTKTITEILPFTEVEVQAKN